MAAGLIRSEIAPEKLRLMLLAYGMDHAYRVITLDEVTQAVRNVGKAVIREGLDRLAEEGLVTKFSGRYCFNKTFPVELRHVIERGVTPSGTVRIR